MVKSETDLQAAQNRFRDEAGLYLPENRFEFVRAFDNIWADRCQEPCRNGVHFKTRLFTVDLRPDELEAVQRKVDDEEVHFSSPLMECDRSELNWRHHAGQIPSTVLDAYDAIFAPQQFATKEEWFELLIRIYGDSVSAVYVDAGNRITYIFGQTKDNQGEVLDAVSGPMPSRPVSRLIAIPTLEAGYGFPGYAAWRKDLLERGFDEQNIIGIDEAIDLVQPCTSAEALGLVRWLQGHPEVTVVYIVATRLHMARVFITTVSALYRVGMTQVKVYAAPTDAASWCEHVTHSQGVETGMRLDLLQGELVRIERYYEKSARDPDVVGLVSARKVLDYLNARSTLETVVESSTL